jgi:hypothetical protein
MTIEFWARSINHVHVVAHGDQNDDFAPIQKDVSPVSKSPISKQVISKHCRKVSKNRTTQIKGITEAGF